MRSLAGKTVTQVEHELHMTDPPVLCSLLSSDIFYLADSPIKRFMVSNTLDSRFYQPLAVPDQTQDFSRPGPSIHSRKPKIMRDPYEFINFFKQNVYHEVADQYHDFLEDIKDLREQHIMIKGHESKQGKLFIDIGKKFKTHIENLEVL